MIKEYSVAFWTTPTGWELSRKPVPCQAVVAVAGVAFLIDGERMAG